MPRSKSAGKVRARLTRDRYHDFTASGRIQTWLDGRLGIEGLVRDGIPAFMLLGVDETLLLEQELATVSA